MWGDYVLFYEIGGLGGLRPLNFITDGKNVNGSEPYAFTKMYLAGAEQQIEIYRPVA